MEPNQNVMSQQYKTCAEPSQPQPIDEPVKKKLNSTNLSAQELYNVNKLQTLAKKVIKLNNH